MYKDSRCPAAAKSLDNKWFTPIFLSQEHAERYCPPDCRVVRIMKAEIPVLDLIAQLDGHAVMIVPLGATAFAQTS